MKIASLFIILLCSQFNLLAQQDDAWVYLSDKEHVTESIANPISILTQKAIDRKSKYSVNIDERDVPVNENYITQLKNTSGITVLAKSKWFNAVHVRGSVTDITNLVTLFSFVDNIDFADKSLNVSKSIKKKKTSKLEEIVTNFNYGDAANQIEMFHGDFLHEQDYTGTGITVAVLDGGFPNVNTMEGFKRLRDAGNLLGHYDFVNRDTDVFTNMTSNHGTMVLSTMAGYLENQYVGTAPDASYYLFITEDVINENPVEESYWVEAVERADSLGVDVINTSLGYTTFDNPKYDYTNADMDGNTAFITKGANIAFEKGMLLVNSAGNSGGANWKIVGAPADAAGVLTVGAVDANGNSTWFSSLGSDVQPTQKPDIVALGGNSYVILESDIIGVIDGTSFSSPIIAGGIACLWQALPNKTNAEIMQLVRESASQYLTPDYELGYGIPNLKKIVNKVLGLDVIVGGNIELNLYPNPTRDMFMVTMSIDEITDVAIFDVLGKPILKEEVTYSNPSINVSSLSKGMYIIKLKSSERAKTIKLIKR